MNKIHRLNQISGEPISPLFYKYESRVTASQLASELEVSVEVLTLAIQGSAELRGFLGELLFPDGSVPRTLVEVNFFEIYGRVHGRFD